MASVKSSVPKYEEFLKNATLIRDKAYINGTWTAAVDGKSFAVNNPATQEKIIAVADCGVKDTELAVYVHFMSLIYAFDCCLID